MNAGNKKHTQHAPSTKTECDYLNGWIKKRSHTQKSHPKVVNPRDIAGERQKKKKKKKDGSDRSKRVGNADSDSDDDDGGGDEDSYCSNDGDNYFESI